MWFEVFDWKRVRTENDAAGGPLFCVKHGRRVTLKTSPERLCPACPNTPLTHVLFSPGSHAHLDECPKCSGCWLEDGELGKIHDEMPPPPADGGGDSGEPSELIKELYRMRTGRKKQHPI